MNKKNATILGGLFAVVVIIIVAIFIGRNVQQKNEQADYQQMVNEVIKSDKQLQKADYYHRYDDDNNEWYLSRENTRFIIFKNNSSNAEASKYFIQTVPSGKDPDEFVNGGRFFEKMDYKGIKWYLIEDSRYDKSDSDKDNEVAKAIYEGLKDGQTEIVYDSAKD